MEKLNCLIVEDEPLATEILQDYISQVPFLECKAFCRDGIFAMQVLQQQKIDVLFLDIHLPKIKGVDFLRTLKKKPQVIITTAYRDYALDGYELNVVDYLLKPISFNRFLMAVNKLKYQHLQELPVTASYTAPLTGDAQIFISVNRRRVKICFDDILYIESKKECINIVTTDNSFLTKLQLSEMEEQLPRERFLRIHRSFIVAIKKVNAFSASDVELNGTQIPIGRSYKEVTISVLERSV